MGRVTAVSSVYETEPMYEEDQAWFLNCVVALETELRPRPLLEALQSIERVLGRRRSVRYGPRTIDLDIVFYGTFSISEPDLEVPHPRVAERLFVLVPLHEIRPSFIHPTLEKDPSQLIEALGSDERAKHVFRRSGPLVDDVAPP